MTARLDPETKRLHALSPAALADEIGDHQTAIEALKAEAIRRELLRVEGVSYRIVLSPPSTSQRTDKAKLLEVLGITAAEFTSRFTHTVQTGWRLTCTPLRNLAAAAKLALQRPQTGKWADLRPAAAPRNTPETQANRRSSSTPAALC